MQEIRLDINKMKISRIRDRSCIWTDT